MTRLTRVKQLERATGKRADKPCYPRWEALGLLGMYGELKQAAELYQAGRYDEIRALLEAILEEDCKHSYRRKDRDTVEMSWAVDEIGRALEDGFISSRLESASRAVSREKSELVR